MTTMIDSKKLKTLADLKRYLQVGTKMTCTFHNNPSRIGWKREVVAVSCTNVVLIDPTERDSVPSTLPLPKASLVEIEGNKFRIFEPGFRDLTNEEKACIAGEPKDPVQEERDLLGDGSTTFYRRKRYYEGSEFPYLQGIGAVNGMSFNGKQVRDPKVKGNLLLEYEITS